MGFDHGVITKVVRTALHDPSLDVGDWSIEPLTGGFGEVTATSEGVCRVRGTAVAASGPVQWSVVRKRLQSAAGHSDPADWDYWKREALAYEADLLRDLPEGFAAPTCLPSVWSTIGISNSGSRTCTRLPLTRGRWPATGWQLDISGASTGRTSPAARSRPTHGCRWVGSGHGWR